MRQLFQGQPDVMSAKKTEHFKQLLETRIAELKRVLTSAQGETRIGTPRHADPADQAASEYERQSLVDKAAAARQMTQTRGPKGVRRLFGTTICWRSARFSKTRRRSV